MGIKSINGISESRAIPIIAKYSSLKDQCVIVCSNYERAKDIALDLSFFVPQKEIIVLPESDNFILNYDAKNRDGLSVKMKALKKLLTEKDVIVISPISSFVKKLVPHTYFESSSFEIKLEDELSLKDIKDKLVSLGYERSPLIYSKGQFSIRGGILDIYTPDGENPYRVEFFGDMVDSIRSFNIDSQLSIEKLSSISIFPTSQISISNDMFKSAVLKIEKEYSKEIKKCDEEKIEKLKERKNTLIEYINEIRNLEYLESYSHYFFDDFEYIYDYMNNGSLIIEDASRILGELKNIDEEKKNDFEYLLEKGEVIPFDKKMITGTDDFIKSFSFNDIYILSPFLKRIKGISEYESIETINSKEVLKYNGNMSSLLGDIKAYIKKEYEINIVIETKERISSLREYFLNEGVSGNINYVQGKITSGIDYPEDKKVWISESDIFLNRKRKRREKKFDDNSSKLRSFTDIKTGDYIVHINHGIGKFVGIFQMDFDGETKDYIKIQYAGTDTLYVPVENLDMVQKYIGSGATPRINRLSGVEWKNVKERTKKEILLMAQDLIDLYAKRSLEKGYQFGKDTVWQNEFEESFPYQETDDQLRAAEEIKKDMEKPIPMDRLLLGDVGFGKTEVAARAAFKCLAEGKQVCFLVPTTILANQHYMNLKERFENFPFKVDVLSRFKSKAEQEKTIEKLKLGMVDFVIGTHRLLSKDVSFKDLGLLIVDEEQRFGVEAKENIKKLKTNVDCLTLTATPIPRTLNMSLNGIKDMSLLENPPLDRYPVSTFVLEEDDSIIRDAIIREMNRGGQVYVVYNRINGIPKICNMISELVPNARVKYAHGRMNESQLEEIMISFINKEIDVLVSTTIIESGLDIQNANTMIILDSDRYGLSELYQLRGRVGRTNRESYCYLMHEPYKVLTEIAEKRLNAIREFTEFGSGFKIAIRDLEIRGAGNLLGEAQSGHMSGVGYELYIKMIENAVRALSGEVVKEKENECHIDLPISAYISNKYIDDEIIKMDMYKKIAAIKTNNDEDEIIDELIDRFGDPPKETINLIKIAHMRFMCDEVGINRVSKVKYEHGGSTIKTKRVKLLFDFDVDNKLNAFSIYNVNEIMGEYVFIHLGKKPYISLSVEEGEMLEKSIEMLSIIMDNTSSNMV